MVRRFEAVVDALGRCDSGNAGLILGKSQSTLANWRTSGIGPAWRKVGGRVYYNYDDLVAYGLGEADASQAA
jgi:hypothetical protein